MARFARCIEGHVFDAEASTRCPICGTAVELEQAASEPMGTTGSSGGGAAAAALGGAPILWLVAGFGVLLIVVAAVILLRSELMPSPPAGQNDAQASAQTPQAPAPPRWDGCGERRSPLRSSSQPQTQASLAPSSPASGPAQSDDQNDQDERADLQSPNGQGSGVLNAPPPASSAPIDGGAFKTSFEDAIGKLSSLAQIDPMVANIATGIAGLNLFNHGEEQAGQAMLQQAAAANVSFAAAALGQQYFGGTKTLRQDYGQARHWFELASHADVPVANYELAVIYARGLNVKQDLKLAGHYFLAAYHGGFQPVVEIVTAARAGQKAQRELLHRLGLDPTGMGMTVLEYYDARHASDPAGALTAIQQLADNLQWPAPNILAMAQWDGDGGTPDRAAAVKNFLVAASGGAFGALIPVAEASLDGTLGAPNPTQAALAAMLVRLYSHQQSAENMDKLNRVYQASLEKASPDQSAQLNRLGDLLSGVAPAGSEAGIAGAGPASSNP